MFNSQLFGLLEFVHKNRMMSALFLIVLLLIPIATNRALDTRQAIIELDNYVHSPLVITKKPPPPKYNLEDYYWMTKNVYYEARNQSDEGMLAVILVTINRVKDPRWPDTVKKVVTQRNPRGCQFSWYCESHNFSRRDKEKWDEIYNYVKQALEHIDTVHDITHGALWYHADYVRPWWARAKVRTAKIGDHIFYREKNT